mmetsp:Transcript_16020/g.26167  ORF Transcript_16020/g.26167 Transcript_16020/m.26167 type:complete len:87 (-) Transcript_16020:2939-3199(-)
MIDSKGRWSQCKQRCFKSLGYQNCIFGCFQLACSFPEVLPASKICCIHRARPRSSALKLCVFAGELIGNLGSFAVPGWQFLGGCWV